MDPPFPLFRLPQLVLNVTFKFLNPKQLINISFCSTKAYRIAKEYRDKSINLELSVTFARFKIIYFLVDEEEVAQFRVLPIPENTGKLNVLRIGSQSFPYIKNEHYEIFTEDVSHGIKILLTYFTEFFDCKINLLGLCSNQNPNSPREFIDWIISRQDSIDDLHLEYRSEMTDDDFKHCLDTLRVTKKAYFYAEQSQNFQHTFSLNTKRVIIPHGQWVTVDNLLAMNSQYLWIANSLLSSNDMNTVLKHWMNGDMPNLKVLRSSMVNLDITAITNGLDATEMFYENELPYDSEEDFELDVETSFQIQRQDGVHASILDDGDNEFIFLVWPDFQGRPYRPN